MKEQIINQIPKIAFIISAIWVVFRVSIIAHFYFVTIKTWKKTDGEIVRAEINNITDKTGDGGWTEQVIYSFTVNGIEFRGNEISKNLQILVPFKDNANHNNFKTGQKIVVTYNPQNPNEAIIEEKFDLMNAVLPFFFFLAGYFFLW